MTHEPIEGYAHVGYGYVLERLPASDLVEKLEQMQRDWASYSSPYDLLGEVLSLVRKHMEGKVV